MVRSLVILGVTLHYEVERELVPQLANEADERLVQVYEQAEELASYLLGSDRHPTAEQARRRLSALREQCTLPELQGFQAALERLIIRAADNG